MPTFPASDILVPVDLSEPSMQALDHATSLARSTSGIHVLTILPELSAMEPGISWGSIDDETRIATMEDALRAKLAERDIDDARVHVVVARGNPGWQIAKEATNLDVDLVVIASHGRTGWQRLAMGSVAERVVRFSPCPVLVVRQTRASR